MHNSYCISVMYILCNWTRLSIAITIINIRNLWDNFTVWVFVVLQALFILEIVKTVYKSILFPTGQTSNHVLDYCKCDIWLWIVPIAVWKHANGELGGAGGSVSRSVLHGSANCGPRVWPTKFAIWNFIPIIDIQSTQHQILCFYTQSSKINIIGVRLSEPHDDNNVYMWVFVCVCGWICVLRPADAVLGMSPVVLSVLSSSVLR
jgi:hypothetical protein